MYFVTSIVKSMKLARCSFRSTLKSRTAVKASWMLNSKTFSYRSGLAGSAMLRRSKEAFVLSRMVCVNFSLSSFLPVSISFET
jgi:hypothetical protein